MGVQRDASASVPEPQLDLRKDCNVTCTVLYFGNDEDPAWNTSESWLLPVLEQDPEYQ